MSALLTTKQAHCVMAGSGRVLERGECLVGLESLTNVLGALVANFVAHKTVRAKQGSPQTVSPLLTTKQAHLAFGMVART
eukprot:scaffold2995_cov120-Isochrysis_galbana.AAC.1